MKRLAFLLPLAGLALFWIGCPRGRSGPASPRVLLIGIDGADLQVIDRLIAEGKLPTFQRLEREGAFGPLRSQEPLLSPIVWTTIVCVSWTFWRWACCASATTRSSRLTGATPSTTWCDS